MRDERRCDFPIAGSKQAVRPNLCVRVLRCSTEPMTSRIVRFISRTEQLRLRGNRNFGRYKSLTHGLVEPNGPERRQWQQESADEDKVTIPRP